MGDLTVEDCNVVVKQCLKIDAPTVDFEAIPRHNDNFIVKITIERDSREETLYFYAKSQSKIPTIDKILYEDFKNIVPGFTPTFTPKFHCGKSQLLFFEDLTCQKFQTQLGFFTATHIHRVLSVLAEFHAAGFAYEEIKSKDLGERCKLNDQYDLDETNIDVKKEEDLIWSLLENKERVQEVIEDLEERQSQRRFRKVLCHSNLLGTNILFHYNNGVPDGCKLVNFKSKLYAPPAYDVLQVIFFNTCEKVRQQHFDSFLSCYHDRLREELEKYHLDVDEIVPVGDLQLSSHSLLPLIKLETVLMRKRTHDKILTDKALQELKEILLASSLTREDCYVILKNKNVTDYEFLSFGTTPLHGVTAFLGNYSSLEIKIRHSLEEKTVSCFVKSMPKDSCRRRIAEEGNYFNKEVFVYDTFVKKLQEEEIDTINDCLPPCYLQRPGDLLVLEDMSLKCRTLSSVTLFDFNLLSTIVLKLAKFHASTIIFEEKMSEKLKRAYNVTDDWSQHLKAFPENSKLVKTGLDSVFAVANLFPDLKTETNEETLKKCWPKLLERFYEESDRYRSVISHGDLSTNDILIKFEGDTPVDCYFVDYQCIRYIPPAYDFLSVLHLTTDRATRLKYEEELKRIYYEELTTVLSSYNYKANKILSFQEFVDGVNYTRPQIVVHTIIRNTVEEISSILVDEEVRRRFFFEDREEYLREVCAKSPSFRSKLRENVLDLYEECARMASSL